MKEIVKKLAYHCLGINNSLYNRAVYKTTKHSGRIAVYNTSMGTHNLGDHIIMQYCERILEKLFPDEQWLEIASHRIPSAEEELQLEPIKYRFVCGTNLLTSTIEKWWNWRLPDGWKGKQKHRNAILLGVGWHEYEPDCTDYTTMIYRTVLNPCVLHSVRDQYSEMKLRQAGIKNVINAGCPTTWALTPEFCRSIPTKKANDVVTTITDYRRDPERDRQMLEILCRNYEHVYVWLQGQQDGEYLDTLMCPPGGTVLEKYLRYRHAWAHMKQF